MKTINLEKIITDHALDVREVGKELFPSAKYPKLALDRILKGEAFLDTNQVSKLSLITGIPIEVLFSGGEWKTQGSENKITFTSEDYKAELDTLTWVTKVYYKGSLFHEEIISQKHIELSEYLETLRNLINKYNKNEQS